MPIRVAAGRELINKVMAAGIRLLHLTRFPSASLQAGLRNDVVHSHIGSMVQFSLGT
jgi:hypothetical protein